MSRANPLRIGVLGAANIARAFTVPMTTPFEAAHVADVNGFRLETESFARVVRGEKNAWSGATPQQSIDIALTIDAVRESARSGGWAQVGE